MFESVDMMWNELLAGPGLLIAVRATAALMIGLYAVMMWWEVAVPTDNDRLVGRDRGQQVMWMLCRLGLAVAATALLVYFLLTGWLERDRGGLPVRLLFSNAALILTFFLLFTQRLLVRYWHFQHQVTKHLSELVQARVAEEVGPEFREEVRRELSKMEGYKWVH